MTCDDTARYSGELPSTTALVFSPDASVTHHHWRWLLAILTTPTTAHRTPRTRYIGERSRWNRVWNRAASRYLPMVLLMPFQARKCSGTMSRRSPPSLGSSFPPATWTGTGLGTVSSRACSKLTSRGTSRIVGAAGGGSSGGGLWPLSCVSVMMDLLAFGWVSQRRPIGP